MSQETTQDLAQSEIEDSPWRHEGHEDGTESTAMLECKDPITGEMMGMFHAHFLPMPFHFLMHFI